MLFLKIFLIIILAPVLGGLLTGLDRIISARIQGRQGPPLLQPFYDVIKLFGKEPIEVNRMCRFYVYICFLFVIFTTVILLIGGDVLLSVFALTLGSIFFVLGAYAANSAYSVIGAERELLQMMAYEPMVLITAAGLYYASGSFIASDIIKADIPAIVYLPGIFVGFMFILLFKLRKAPFDLSMSHHAHQEIVQGIATEYSGKELAIIHLTHWYESVYVLGLTFLFFATSNPMSYVYATVICFFVFISEIFISNACARVKWQLALKSAWIVTGILSIINLSILTFFK